MTECALRTVLRRWRGMLAIVTLASLAAAGCHAPTAPSRVVYFDAEPIADIDQALRVQPEHGDLPTGQPYIALHQYGPDAARYRVDGPVSDFTGFAPPWPRKTYQRACDPVAHEATACQAFSDTVGFFTNSVFAPNDDILRSAVYSYNWPLDNAPRPWSLSPAASLVFELERKVPYSKVRDGGVTYTQEYVILRDRVSGQQFWFGATSFDSRDEFREFVMMDDWEKGTNLPIVMMPYGEGTHFGHRGPGSAKSTGIPWRDWRYFALRVTGEELMNAVEAMKAEYPQIELSADPADYELLHMSCLAEMYTPRNGRSRASLGTATRRVRLFSVVPVQ